MKWARFSNSKHDVEKLSDEKEREEARNMETPDAVGCLGLRCQASRELARLALLHSPMAANNTCKRMQMQISAEELKMQVK